MYLKFLSILLVLAFTLPSMAFTYKLNPIINNLQYSRHLKKTVRSISCRPLCTQQNLHSNHNVHKKDFFPPLRSTQRQLEGEAREKSIFQKLKDKFPSKDDIAKMGVNVLLSYGFVSNFSYVTSFIIAWVIHGKKTGLSPLYKGQWKYFLGIYTGFWAANNLIRPLRLSLSLLLAPIFESLVDKIQVKTKTKRATATAILVFLVNVIGTLSYLFGGLYLASLVFKVKLLA